MEKISTKKLAIVAMLVAFHVIFTHLIAINTPIMKIGFGFAATAVCAMAYGPVWAAVCGAMSDLIGATLFPTGPYFPGFTLTAALTGVIFGLLLYRKRPDFKKCFLAALLNCLIVTLVLNTFMISFVFGPKFWPLFITRLTEFGIMTAVETAVMWGICASKTLYGKIIDLRR